LRGSASGISLKRSINPGISRGEIDEEILSRFEESGKTITARCEAGIYWNRIK